MTYIIGAKYEGHAAIICDSLVQSEQSGFSDDGWLKSGLLFTGCSYAYCGAVIPAQNFIIAFKKGLHRWGAIAEIWRMFQDFAASYSYSKDASERFQLLLSCRASGIPELYTLDSCTGQIKPEGDFVTLGKGKTFFDIPIRETIARRHELIDDEISGTHPAIYPANWCLQLMERAQGLETTVLKAMGVGGFSHFSYQTSEEESRQPPTLYILCDHNPTKKQYSAWVYRVGFCDAALIVDCPIRNQRWVILESASWPRILTMGESEVNDLKKEIDAKVAEQPFYNICGFGSPNPSYRKRNPMVITSGTDYVIDRNGEQTPKFDVMVAAVFGSDDQASDCIRRLQVQ